MSYSIKYTGQFMSIDNHLYTVNFYKKDYTGSTIEIKFQGDEPFITEVPEVEMFEPIVGIGGTINLISQSDRQFIDLFTNDFKGWICEVKKESDIIFLGYTESELYSEVFNKKQNYPVSVVVNSGLGILDRIPFVDTDGSFYDYTSNVYDVIKMILDKIELDFDSINVITDIVINGLAISSDKSILQYLTVNLTNFYDEDGVAFDCRKVLESVLSANNLSISIIGTAVYIYDMALLKNASISVKQFGYDQTVCYNNTIYPHNSNIKLFDSSYNIVGAVNYLKFTLNRYIKNIIEEVNFDKEVTEITPEIASGLSGRTFLTGATNDYQSSKFWVRKHQSFDNYTINTTDALPLNNSSYYTNLSNTVAFAGGYKDQYYVDDVLINFDADDKSYDNYIIINNPFYPYASGITFGNNTKIPYSPYAVGYPDVSRKAFEYTVESPLINNSSTSKIRINYTFKPLSAAIVDRYQYSNNWYTILNDPTSYTNQYGSFVIPFKVLFYDSNDNLQYFIQSDIIPTGSTSTFENIKFSLIKYTGQTDTFCYTIAESRNELGLINNCMNQDIDTYFDVPISFDKQYFMKIEVWNRIARIYDQISGTSILTTTVRGDHKESLPHFLFKDISTTFIDEYGEEVDLSDTELQYYISEQYKTESNDFDLYNYTASNKYPTDAGGVSVNNSGVYDYITGVTSESYIESNLEDLKADKIINQINNQTIVINGSVTGIFNQLSVLIINSDALWSDKKWFLKALSNNYKLNRTDVTMIEIK